jgi:protein ImuA
MFFSAIFRLLGQRSMQTLSTTIPQLDELRLLVNRIERTVPAQAGRVVPFGLPALDARLPGGGLRLGALHEVAGWGAEAEHAAAASLMIGGILARMPGQVLWVLERRDLFAPGLAAVGLDPDRVIYAETRRTGGVLAVMEEGLRHAGLAGVVGEVFGKLGLTASRRLQLAAEHSGVTGFALRRSRAHDNQVLAEPSAAATRWRIAALPSPPALAQSPDTPGLARARWQLELVRCRGGEPATWIVEASDAQGHLRLAADLAHRPAAPDAHRPAAPDAHRPAAPQARTRRAAG